MNELAGRFKLCVVGAGRMGLNHVEALANSPHVSVTAIVEPREDARSDLSARGLNVYPSVDRFLEGERADGVIVAAPTDSHRELVAQLASAGLPVLCEKPCGSHSTVTRECVAIAERVGVPFQVAYWRRYVPELSTLRARIADGELGDVICVHAQQWDQSPPPSAFRARSGGIFVDMGVHEFDQIRWLTGCEFETVKAVVSGPPAVDAESGDPDCGHVIARMSNGATAVVSLGRWHPTGDSCRVDVYGSKCTASAWFLQPDSGDLVFKEALRHQAEDFARRVVTGEGRGASAHDAVAALEVAERAHSDAFRTSQELQGALREHRMDPHRGTR